MSKILLALFFSLLFPFFAFAQGNYYSDAARGKTGFYGEDSTKGKVGFYGYEPVKDDAEKEKEKKDKDKPQHRLPDLKDYTVQQLWNMYPDDFQALVTEFDKKAVMTLSPSDVEAYWRMVDISRRKSLAYANVTDYVMQTHPELNVSKDNPNAAPGRNALTTMQLESVDREIRSGMDNFALLFFYSPECDFCKAQSGILHFFMNKYSWEVKPIDWNARPDLKARFNIQTVPTILLIYREKSDSIPVAIGVTALDDMETSIYRGMRLLKGEITPQEWSSYDFQKGTTFDAGMPASLGVNYEK